MTKIIGSLIALALTMTGGYELLNSIQPQSEQTVIYNSIDSTLNDANSLMALNGLDLKTAVQTALQENPKGLDNGMIYTNGYIVYSINNTCMQGTINGGVNVITTC